MTKEIVADPKLVARCGLYCGACGRYLKGKCPGCSENEKATWCGVRSCCIENDYATCADCKTHSEPNDCKKFNNFMSKVFAFLFRSNRSKCVAMIREKGLDGYAEDMASKKRMSMPR